MKKSLSIYVAITTIALSLSAAYAADLPPPYDYCEYEQKEQRLGSVITQADSHLQAYKQLINGAEQSHTPGVFKDKTLSAKSIMEIEAATEILCDPKITKWKDGTEESTEWYLNFARIRGQNIASRFNCKDVLYDVTKGLTIAMNAFRYNADNDINHESEFKNNPGAKLRMQLTLLTTCAIGGANSYKILSFFKTDPYFVAGFKKTIKDMEPFILRMQDMHIPAKFTNTEWEIYQDPTQQNVHFVNSYKVIINKSLVRHKVPHVRDIHPKPLRAVRYSSEREFVETEPPPYPLPAQIKHKKKKSSSRSQVPQVPQVPQGFDRSGGLRRFGGLGNNPSLVGPRRFFS